MNIDTLKRVTVAEVSYEQYKQCVADVKRKGYFGGVLCMDDYGWSTNPEYQKTFTDAGYDINYQYHSHFAKITHKKTGN